MCDIGPNFNSRNSERQLCDTLFKEGLEQLVDRTQQSRETIKLWDVTMSWNKEMVVELKREGHYAKEECKTLKKWIDSIWSLMEWRKRKGGFQIDYYDISAIC